MAQFPMTVKGKEQLQVELKKLLSEERPKVIQAIEEARAHGDLSENAEYSAAKEKQSFIEGRIEEINSKLAQAQVIDPLSIKEKRVVFGATVQLHDIDSGERLEYQIVGEDESDVKKGKISITSPIARGLIGKVKGDEVEVIVPKGTKNLEILSVQYI